MDIQTILAILGSSTITAVVMAWLNRRRDAANVHKVNAEADQIEINNRQNETAYYQRRVDETIAQMVVLEAQVKELKLAIEIAQKQYEQRVGTLHTKIDDLALSLERANNQLDAANKTIGDLRKEVKEGNTVITELRKEISQLLIDRAEKGAADASA